MTTKNVFSGLPVGHSAGEVFEPLVETGRVKIERIVSTGQSSPEGFWYDQEQDEWVMVLRGGAGLLFEGSSEAVRLGPGDWINIPAHARHRVAWTDPDQPTVWLAVHYRP